MGEEMRRLITAGLGLLFLATPALAEEITWQDVIPQLEGCWEGTGLGGDSFECWVVHEDGRADGMFLQRQDSKPSFAEILTIDEFETGVEMRLKHVFPDMKGWEEKDDFVTFPFVEAKPDSLIFNGLIIRFVGDDTLEIDVTLHMKDGSTQVMPFKFARTATLDRPKN